MNTDEQMRRILAGITDMTAGIRELDARVSERMKVSAILIAYDQARQDPHFKCPSYLMAAIEAARE